MTETEIRRTIAEVCAELDRRARRLVVPSVLGAGLALGGCGDRTTPTDSMVPRPDAAYGIRADGWLPNDVALYMAPFDARADRLLKRELPPVPPYMAPDYGPPQPDYLAPDPDGGAAPLYAVPQPDLK